MAGKNKKTESDFIKEIKAYEQQKKDAKARHEATKNAIKSEADYWKSLKK